VQSAEDLRVELGEMPLNLLACSLKDSLRW
jgi:hypothetical protein